MLVELETPRLRLRPLDLDDDAALFSLFSDAEMMEYWGTPHASVADTRRMIESILTSDGLEWAVTLDGLVIGKVCHHRWLKDHARSEIGYILAKEQWGRGLVTEALKAIIKFGFATMSLHSIEAQVDPRNARSVRVLERLGFTKEGHLRENFNLRGTFVDTAIYSLLESSRGPWRDEGVAAR